MRNLKNIVCKNCKFYDPKSNDFAKGLGLCRKNAPVVMPIIDSATGANQEDVPCWPQVEDWEWCGEWREIPASELYADQLKSSKKKEVANA